MTSDYDSDNSTYYDAIATSYDRLHYDEQIAKLKTIKHALKKILNNNKTKNILPIRSYLDVGCGSGISTKFFSDLLEPKLIIGIDPSKNLIKLAKKRVPAAIFIKENAEQFNKDIKQIIKIKKTVEIKNSIPYSKSTDKPVRFDLITSITAAQNFFDIKKSLLNIKKASKKLIIISTLKKASNAKEIKNLILDIFKDFNIISNNSDDKDNIYIIINRMYQVSSLEI